MNPADQDTIIFLHVPKTAGRTLNSIIRNQYEPASIFANGEAVISRLGKDWGKTTASERWEISREILAGLPEPEKRKIKVLLGHMNFGRHELLPQPCTYVTLLREPKERILSHYYHILRMKEHHLYHTITTRKMTVGDYIRSGITFTADNGQTRMISGAGDRYEYGRCPREILEKARSNLREHFSIAGLMEEFDETLILIRREFNWSPPYYRKQNVTHDRPALEDIPGGERRIIEEHNRLDIELYKYARELFKEKLSRQGPSFEKELRQFQRQNNEPV
ncbi:MAG: sulfotransferase family 2 domain-containing protein [bacterium]|nr:sulfotransferase family 2 domain-containing protein [bacterium]